MDDEKRIPRVRIHEDNFSEEIKNLSCPEIANVDGQPIGFFIEVVSEKDEVVASLFQAKLFTRVDYRDVMDYVKYYDNIVVDKMENEGWADRKEKYILSVNKIQKEMIESEDIRSWWNVYPLYHIAIFIVTYGRLKYPLGLSKKYLEKCKAYIELSWIYELIPSRYYTNDFKYEAIDILNFILARIKTEKGIEYFNRLILNSSIDKIVGMDLEVISAIADNLFTQDNIYFFVDKARIINHTNAFRDHYDSVLDFLCEYKDKHFPSAKRSPQYQLFGIQRVKQLESGFPRRMPLDKKDYFLDVIDKDERTKALLFIVDAKDFLNIHTLWECEGLDEFVASIDEFLTPNEHWGNVEIQNWLPNRLDDERMEELLNDAGVSDVSELRFTGLPEGWADYIYEYYDSGPRESDLPALFLMAYGRLKYPYKLTEEIRKNCETYIKESIDESNLIDFLTGISDDPKDIVELFNFYVGVFPDNNSFRAAFVNDYSIKELVLCDPEIFIAIADSILCKENIERFLDEAHAENKTELKLFLLDYKNKHFQVDGEQLERLSE